MGSKPRSTEDYITRLVIDKGRAIYWLCALLERDSAAVRDGARRALGELGYDEARIHALLLLGEPGGGAREVDAPSIPSVVACATLKQHGPGTG